MKTIKILVAASISMLLGTASPQTWSEPVADGSAPALQLKALKEDVEYLKQRVDTLEALLPTSARVERLQGRYVLVDTLDDVNDLTAANLQGHYTVNLEASTSPGPDTVLGDELDISSLLSENSQEAHATFLFENMQADFVLTIIDQSTIQLDAMVPEVSARPMRFRARVSQGGNRLTLADERGRTVVYDRLQPLAASLSMAIDDTHMTFTASYTDGKTETTALTLAAIVGPILLVIDRNTTEDVAFENLATFLVLTATDDGRLTLLDAADFIGAFFDFRFQTSRFTFMRQ
jgi:hypothetical protein